MHIVFLMFLGSVLAAFPVWPEESSGPAAGDECGSLDVPIEVLEFEDSDSTCKYRNQLESYGGTCTLQGVFYGGRDVIYKIRLHQGNSAVRFAIDASTADLALALLGPCNEQEAGCVKFCKKGENCFVNSIDTIGPGVEVIPEFSYPAGTYYLYIDSACDPPPGGATPTPPCGSCGPYTLTISGFNPLPDLELTVTADRDRVTAGEQLTYGLQVSNRGQLAATDVVVSYELPAGVSFAGADRCELAAAELVRCEIGTLEVGDSAEREITVTVGSAAAGGLSSVFEVRSEEADPNLGDNLQVLLTTVVTRADLTLALSASPKPVIAGEQLTYTFRVTNSGPSDARHVVITDHLPAAVRFASQAGCSEDSPGIVTCDLGLLKAGRSVERSITVDVDSSATGRLGNTAEVRSDEPDSDPGDNLLTVSTGIETRADLAITKRAAAPQAVAGETLIYELTVSNLGPSDARDVTVTDHLPAGVTLEESSGCAEDPGGAPLCSLANVPAGTSKRFQIRVRVEPETRVSVTNGASVASSADHDDLQNNTAPTETPVTVLAELTLSNDNGQESTIPGNPVTYTITVRNAGPSSVTADVVDTDVSKFLTDCSWTCTGENGARCNAGQGLLDDSADLPAGGRAIYTQTCTVDPSATGSLVNTAMVTPREEMSDPDVSNNTGTDTDLLTPQADLEVFTSDTPDPVATGGELTYTLVVSNRGPSDAPQVSVEDDFPDELSASWECKAPAGASCGSGEGEVLLDQASLPAGSTLTYSITLTPDSRGILVNPAEVEVSGGVTDPDPDNNSDRQYTRVGGSDLEVTVDDGREAAAAGEELTYTIKVTNNGPDDVAGARVIDRFPPELLPVSWTCTPGDGATCTATGAGEIDDSVGLPAGRSVIYQATATAPAGSPRLANSVRVKVPADGLDRDPTNNSATDVTTLGGSNLEIAYDDTPQTAAPGDSLTYTIRVTNLGPEDLEREARVSHSFPPQLTEVTCSVGDCTASGIDDTQILGESVTYGVTGTIAEGFRGILENSARVAAPAGTVDSDPGNNTAAVTTTVGGSNLAITTGDGLETAASGQLITYNIAVTNLGPEDLEQARITATFSDPEAFPDGVVWTRKLAGGARPPGVEDPPDEVRGRGDIDELLDLPADASVTYTADALLASDFQGSITQTATVELPENGFDPDPSNNSATDLTPVGGSHFRITKTDGLDTASAGMELTYTIEVKNLGPEPEDPEMDVEVMVSDEFPQELTGVEWTCLPVGDAICTPGPMLGNIEDDPVTLPAYDRVTYTAQAMTTGGEPSLENTATLAFPEGVEEATDVTTVGGANLTIRKTDGRETVAQGQLLTYRIEVRNLGPEDVVGAQVIDNPQDLTKVTWSCAAFAGGECGAAEGTDGLWEFVNLDAGSTVVYTLRGTASKVGLLSNIATIDPDELLPDPDRSNNQATDMTEVQNADLAITKVDGLETAVPGQRITYTIEVTNHGPAEVREAHVTDDFPPATDLNVISCSATGEGSCTASGIDDMVDLLPGEAVTYTVVGDIEAGFSGTLTNTARVDPPLGLIDRDPNNNHATDKTEVLIADLAITKTDRLVTAVPGQVITYTIEVTNHGSAAVSGARVQDTFPTGLTDVSCIANPPAACTAAGIDDMVDLLPGEAVTYTVTGTIAIDFTGNLLSKILSNTAEVETSGGLADPDPTNNQATDTTLVASCTAGATSLCLNGDRFGVRVQWRDFQGNSGEGRAEKLTDDAGYFWFFAEANVELALKVLDGRPINGHWWIFYGALSNVEYTLTVTDGKTGETRIYFNPLGKLASVADIEAFPDVGSSSAIADVSLKLDTLRSDGLAFVDSAARSGSPQPAADWVLGERGGAAGKAAGSGCTADATNLCLSGDRFEVRVRWLDFQDRTGDGQAVKLTVDSGYFWFFAEANVELLVKVLDGRPINGHWWVFYGALSNVGYSLTVTDTVTGASKIYTNPPGRFASEADVTAFED